MWLVEVVNANKQLSFLKKNLFSVQDFNDSAKQSFFWTSNSDGHGSHGNKNTILILGSAYFLMSAKLYFVEYIKSYRYLSALCWKLWIQIFSTEKTS